MDHRLVAEALRPGVILGRGFARDPTPFGRRGDPLRGVFVRIEKEESGHPAVPGSDHDVRGKGIDRLVGDGLVPRQDLDPRGAVGMIDRCAEDTPVHRSFVREDEPLVATIGVGGADAFASREKNFEDAGLTQERKTRCLARVFR